MVRVLFDITLAERSHGGTLSYTRQLVAALRQDGRVQLSVSQLPKRFGGRCLVHRALNALEITLWMQIRIRRILTQTRSDLLHMPSHIAPWGLMTPLVITMYDVTFLATPHDRVWGVYSRLVAVRSVREASAIVTLSESARREILGAYPASRGKVWVIPPGIDIDFGACADGDGSEVGHDALGISSPYVLSVAAQDPRKNLDRLVAAFGRLKKRPEWRDLKLVMVGREGRASHQLKRKISLLPDPNAVIQLDYVSQQQLKNLYRNATLLAFPSLWEGFGLPILEAMACGTPVVSSNISSMPEVAGDAALLVDPYNVEELEDAMHRILTDGDLRHDLVAKGFDRVRQFTWDRSVASMVSLYTTILALPF